MELLHQLPLPLFCQMRRAEDGQPPDFAAVEQLAGDDRRLDGLADADVIGNQELSIRERMAELGAYYAGLDGEVEGGAGRFRERLAAESEPGWDRAP